jgi:hypothetical protein
MSMSATGRARRMRLAVGLAPNAETSQPSQNTTQAMRIAASTPRASSRVGGQARVSGFREVANALVRVGAVGERKAIARSAPAARSRLGESASRGARPASSG